MKWVRGLMGGDLCVVEACFVMVVSGDEVDSFPPSSCK